MKVIRVLMLVAAVTLPTTWTLAQAGDEMGAGGSGGEMKKDNAKKKTKKDSGDMGDMKKGEMDKK